MLLCIAANPEMRLRDIAGHVGITERAAQRIVSDLADAEYIEREKTGRRNRYGINRNREMRHPAQLGYDIGLLLNVLNIKSLEAR